MTMDPAIRLEAAEWLERARSLAPIAEQHREQAEQDRHMAEPIVQAMRERGLFSLWCPKAFGGAELPIETSVLIMEELGRQDGSVGWNSMISGNHSILWAYLPREVATELTQGGRTVIAGTIAGGGDASAPGGGVATVVPGGFRLTGRWAFASGCHQADWMVANGRIAENGELRKTAQGNVGLFSFIMPPEDVTLLDTWTTTGMRGTGSHHFEATDAFVPEERMFTPMTPRSSQQSPLYRAMITIPWSANIAGVGLGIARDALDTFIELGQVKRANLSGTSTRERETVHRAVGECEGRLRAARAFLLETSREVDACIARGEDIPDELGAMMRCAASNASLSASEVVITMFRTGGSTSFYATSRLDRCFRDVNTLTQHAVGGLAGATVAGRYFMGLGLSRL
jgi:indole-3-acetate monooxygenase